MGSRAEALAAGVPVITTDRVATAANLGDAAFVIPANALDPLVHALDTALGDEALRKALSARGLARAGCYSWKETAQSTYRVYRCIAEDRWQSCASE